LNIDKDWAVETSIGMTLQVVLRLPLLALSETEKPTEAAAIAKDSALDRERGGSH